MQNNQESSKEERHETKSENDVKNPIRDFSAMSGSRKATFIGVIVVVIVLSVYIIFFTGSSSDDNDNKEKDARRDSEKQTEQPAKVSANNDAYKEAESNRKTEPSNIEKQIIKLKPPEPPVLEAPKIESPEPTPPPLPIVETKPELPKIPLESNEESDQTGPSISSTSVMAFGGSSDSKDKEAKKPSHTDEDFLGFDGGAIDGVVLKKTSAKNTVATKINSDLRYSIIQGKVVEGVLETAINTQLDVGVVRALVSHDVYAEQGDIVLIPKGSRLIGKYSKSQGSSNAGISTRVYAVWDRIITPSGVDINLPKDDGGSIAVDPLGRNGIPGYVDTNLSNTLTNAFLVSVLGPYIVAKATGMDKEKVVKQIPVPTPDGSNNSNSNMNTVTVSNAGTQIISDGVSKFQSVATDQINKQFPPNITNIFVDQGTKVNIIVRQDIVFPKQAITSNHIALP